MNEDLVAMHQQWWRWEQARKAKQMIDQPLAEKCIAFLNEALSVDRRAISALLFARTPCNEAMQNHPTIQVCAEPDTVGGMGVGMLGILNGMCGVFDSGARKGWGPITAVIEEGAISRFELTKNEPVASE